MQGDAIALFGRTAPKTGYVTAAHSGASPTYRDISMHLRRINSGYAHSLVSPALCSPDDEGDDEYNRAMKGCKTKPLRLRVTAQGSFLDNVPVFPGDAKTEGMLEQLFHFFGPDKAGLIMQGTLTCRQQWDLEHPDYMIPKPGYPSDVAVKIPHGSSLGANFPSSSFSSSPSFLLSPRSSLPSPLSTRRMMTIVRQPSPDPTPFPTMNQHGAPQPVDSIGMSRPLTPCLLLPPPQRRLRTSSRRSRR